jgi:hypothetical protein
MRYGRGAEIARRSGRRGWTLRLSGLFPLPRSDMMAPAKGTIVRSYCLYVYIVAFQTDSISGFLNSFTDMRSPLRDVPMLGPRTGLQGYAWKADCPWRAPVLPASIATTMPGT